MSLSLKHLEAFVAVADLRSFKRAGERLNTTQPNISARIAALEAMLGVTLMERDAGSVRLTPRGEALLPQARAVLRSRDDFILAADNAALFDGTLRLGVTEMIAHAWVGAFLRSFTARFPNIRVELSVDMSVHVSEALFHRSVDLALQNGPFDRQISGQVELGQYPMIWVAAPRHGVGERVVAAEELVGSTILTHARGTRSYEQTMEHLKAAGCGHARLATSTTLAACRQMTVDGLGIACLPAAMVKRDLAEGRLRQVAYPWAPDALEFFARYDAGTAPAFVATAAEIAAEISAAEIGSENLIQSIQ